MKKFLELLGHEVEDKVTGFKGTVEAVSFELFGCVQVVVRPKGMTTEGKMFDGRYFDHSRLTVKSTTPVMEPPDFEAIAARLTKEAPQSTPTNVPGGNREETIP